MSIQQIVQYQIVESGSPVYQFLVRKLKGKMLLFGHLDYDAHGGEIMEGIRDVLRDEAKATGRIPLPAGGSVRAAALPEM